MTQHVLNILARLTSYNDAVTTDNPMLRSFDVTRKIDSVAVSNPVSDNKTLAPGESLTLFDGQVATSVSGASTGDLELASSDNSVYRLSVTGPAGFRTARSVSGITVCDVTVNNNAVALFDFTGASLGAVQTGDIMRISGTELYDTGPFAFNPLNAGLWVVLGISSGVVTAKRQTGEPFLAVVETVATVNPSDVSFYSSAGVQKGQKISLSAPFSSISQKIFEVLAVTPDMIDFVSADPLPEETGLTLSSTAVIIYKNAKKVVYLETDQDCVLRFNGDTSNNVKVGPVSNGQCQIPGVFLKWGDAYSCILVNQSVNSLHVRYLTAE